MRRIGVALLLAGWAGLLQAEPNVEIRLPERFRVLAEQRFDLRVEATGLSDPDAVLTVRLRQGDRAASVPEPEVVTGADEDSQALGKSWTFRNLSLPAPGVWELDATVADGDAAGADAARIGVQNFRLAEPGKSVILMIGDALGTAYRDAGRIVGQSANGRFREGFFDQNQQMDSMPVTGMVMTYALDHLVSDSANSAAAWSTGNRTVYGALSALPDNNDFRFDARDAPGTKQFALDNPRVETLWEYLKRRYGYKTGIVTTADVTDATPAAAASHTISRTLGYEIARQYVDGTFLAGPAFDVILGGGRERFLSRTAANSGDTRNLVRELMSSGYEYARNRTELNRIPDGPAAPDKLLGLFRVGDMNVAYDKLGLQRPPDEAVPDFAGSPDQPFLREMVERALQVLSRDGAPFILLVEGASIDKESHANRAVGTLWDTIEFDQAVGAARRFAAGTGGQPVRPPTLVLVTGDHDQSMQIVGVTDTEVAGAVWNTHGSMTYPRGGNTGEIHGFPDYVDGDGDGFPENANRYRLAIGFRTENHTGSSVPLTAEGPGALLFTGYYDQTDIFFKIARVLASDTGPLDRGLETKESFPVVPQNY